MTKLGGGGSCGGSTGGATVLRQNSALAVAVVHVQLFATGSCGSSKSLSSCQDQAGLGWWLGEGFQRKPA